VLFDIVSTWKGPYCDYFSEYRDISVVYSIMQGNHSTIFLT
jgi:hypothetical protein